MFLRSWMGYITEEVFRVFLVSTTSKFILVKTSNILFDNKDNMLDIMALLNQNLVEAQMYNSGRKRKTPHSAIWEFIITDLKEKLIQQALEL